MRGKRKESKGADSGMDLVGEKKKSGVTVFGPTAFYSLLHVLVDGVCAFAMFGTFLVRPQGYDNVLTYNFCAFALQMPLGAALDVLNPRRGKVLPLATACMGVALTLVGAFTHPALLGIGNALFHVGGGVGTIFEDREKGWQGRGLGVFVAPGALGLYLGALLAKNGAGIGWLWGVGAFMLLACAGAAGRVFVRGSARGSSQGGSRAGAGEAVVQLASGAARGLSQGGLRAGAGEAVVRMASGAVRGSSQGGSRAGTADVAHPVSCPVRAPSKNGVHSGATGVLPLAACLLLVVILRSHIGMTVTFPWKTTALAGFFAALAVAAGKAAGGFWTVGLGSLRTILLSLAAAAVCYLFSGYAVFGLAALFLFNVTMPVTLYLLVRRLPRLPGFSFGLLTFGLFLGFLPAYFGVAAGQDGNVAGCIGSMVSLVILVCGILWDSREHAGG